MYTVCDGNSAERAGTMSSERAALRQPVPVDVASPRLGAVVVHRVNIRLLFSLWNQHFSTGNHHFSVENHHLSEHNVIPASSSAATAGGSGCAASC